jgi:hypothetical protein
MPGLDRSEHDIAAGGLRRPPEPLSDFPCGTGRLATAAKLIAIGSQLAVPHLDGVQTRHQVAFGIQSAARLGLSLLEAGIADAKDWSPDRKNPVEFVENTFRRWALKNGGEEIATEFDVAFALVSDLEPYSDGDSSTAIAQEMYMLLEPETAGYVVLCPLLRELAGIHCRLPVTFFNLFTSALNRWVRVYDLRDAEERVEMLRECYESDHDSEHVELPDVKGAIPKFLQTRNPLLESSLERLAEKTRDKRIQAILSGLLQLSAASRKAQRPEIGAEASDRLADSNPPLPALLAVFEKQDTIEGCFDEEAQGMMECPPEPNVIIPFKIAEVDSVKTAFGIAEVVCDVLTRASRLIKLIMANVN